MGAVLEGHSAAEGRRAEKRLFVTPITSSGKSEAVGPVSRLRVVASRYLAGHHLGHKPGPNLATQQSPAILSCAILGCGRYADVPRSIMTCGLADEVIDETSRIHHPNRRCHSGVAARSARAVGENASDRLVKHKVAI